MVVTPGCYKIKDWLEYLCKSYWVRHSVWLHSDMLLFLWHKHLMQKSRIHSLKAAVDHLDCIEYDIIRTQKLYWEYITVWCVQQFISHVSHHFHLPSATLHIPSVCLECRQFGHFTVLNSRICVFLSLVLVAFIVVAHLLYYLLMGTANYIDFVRRVV